MPRRQKKETDSAGNNDALTLLRLQQQVLQLTTAKTALEDVQKLVHETALYNFTSAQDRRTLNTAQCCLNSLRIRVEAQVNTVEETVASVTLSTSAQRNSGSTRCPSRNIDEEKAMSPFPNKHWLVLHPVDWIR